MLDAVGGFRAAFLYVANWYFIRQSTDYFAANINSQPGPALLVARGRGAVLPGVAAAARRAVRRRARASGGWRWWALRIVVAAAAVASAVAALHLADHEPCRVRTTAPTPARTSCSPARCSRSHPSCCDSVSALAASWRDGHRPSRSRALLVLATSLVDSGPITRGVVVAGLAVLLIVALENANGGVTKRVLSTRPFTYLGRISYGMYLWHWPIIVIAAHERSLSPLALFVLSCAGATALAALSFHLVEQPVRTSRKLDRFKVPVIAIGLTASIVSASS